MKRKLFVLTLICLLLSSCIKEGSGVDVAKPVSVSGVSFKKMDLNGVGTLALVAPGKVVKSAAVTKADEENGVFLLYEVNEDGTLVEVDYTIVVETEGDQDIVGETVTAYLKLAMQSVFTIGDNWLWLYNCQYYCENLEEIENEALRNSVVKLIDDFGTGHSFLVRRSDGALFPWDDVSNPATSYIEMNHCIMTQFEVNQFVYIVGENIVSCVYGENGLNKLFYLEDKGDILDVKQLLNDSVWADPGFIIPVPGEDAFFCSLSHVEGLVIMFPKTNVIKRFSNNEGVSPGVLITNNRIFACLAYLSSDDVDDDNNVIKWLHLDSSGEDIYLFDSICSVTLEKEETIYMRSIHCYNDNGLSSEQYFNLKVDENDPMSFAVSGCRKQAETGITLQPGKYEFFLSGKTLYVDRSGERIHQVGPYNYIYFLTVDPTAQTASCDDLCMSYWGLYIGYKQFQFEDDPLSFVAVRNGVGYSALLDLEKKEYSFKTFKIPDDFPSEDWEYTGWNAYKMVGTSDICIYSLETMQKETFPIIMTELPSDIVGNIEWHFDERYMIFFGEAKTLEGSNITIYVPVTGDKRGVARISIDEASGAGDIVSQIIRLN